MYFKRNENKSSFSNFESPFYDKGLAKFWETKEKESCHNHSWFPYSSAKSHQFWIFCNPEYICWLGVVVLKSLVVEVNYSDWRSHRGGSGGITEANKKISRDHSFKSCTWRFWTLVYTSNTIGVEYSPGVYNS